MTDAIKAGARAVRAAWEAQGEVPFPLYDREADAIAKACIEAAIASGALVPASAVAEMRERCAERAESQIVKEFDEAWIITRSIRQLDLSPACGDYVVVPRESRERIAILLNDILPCLTSRNFTEGRAASHKEICDLLGIEINDWREHRVSLHAATRTGGEK